MPIANFTGIYSTTVTQTSPISFTPSAGANPTLSAGGALFVWVGAQVQPAITQAAGTYTGTVTMTVVY
jgi:hypothetical protein